MSAQLESKIILLLIEVQNVNSTKLILHCTKFAL